MMGNMLDEVVEAVVAHDASPTAAASSSSSSSSSPSAGAAPAGSKPEHLDTCARDYWKRNYQLLAKQIKGYASLRRKRAAEDAAGAGPRAKKARVARAALDQRAADLEDMYRPGPRAAGRVAVRLPASGALVAGSQEARWKQMVMGFATKTVEFGGGRTIDVAARSFGYGQCVSRMDGGKRTWMLPGMRSGLLDYQLAGVRWMLGREFSPEGPYGGILADEMGLGKTVQMLAAMSQNLPGKDPEHRKDGAAGGTLLVVPASAINQWQGEIKVHATCFKRVLHLTAETEKGSTVDSVRANDIVYVHDRTVALPPPPP